MRLGLSAALAVLALATGAGETENASANGDTRTISIYHTHSKETATITFKRDGEYDRSALEKLNWILRDWRTQEPTRMDPKLFDALWEVHREVGSQEPFNVVSAYRAPETNAMLRRRSRAVAKHSQHMLGKAMDFFLPDVSIDKIRAVGMRLQRGGVGYYPTSHSPFVHIDVGSVRSWPRMSHDQLAQLFPDGKTVHLPSDGKPLAGYELAKAEILARGGSVMGATAYADAGESAVPSGPRKSLWASLFGGDDDEDADVAPTPRRGGRSTPAPVLASAGDDSGTRSFFLNDGRAAPRAAPTQPTALAALEKQAQPAPQVVAQNASQAAASAPLSPTAPVMTMPAPVATDAPVPPRRPDNVPVAVAMADAPAARLNDVPLPPARPVSLTSLTPPNAADAKALTALAAAASIPALAFAPADHPEPPARPSSLREWTASPVPAATIALDAPLSARNRIAAVHAANPTLASEHSLKTFLASATGSLPRRAPSPAQGGPVPDPALAMAPPQIRNAKRPDGAPIAAGAASTALGFR